MGSGASTQQGRSTSPYPAGEPPSFWKIFREECAKVEAQVEKRLESEFQEELEERQKGGGEDLSQDEQAALRQSLKEDDEKSHPAWDAQDALSEILAKTLSTALVKGFLPESGCPKNMDIAFVRALARESPTSILKQLQHQQLLETLAEQIHREAVQISQEVAATGADLNDKYAVATDKGFTMNFGSMVDFSRGLEQRIGSPNPNLLVSMIWEHCASCDSHREWTTRNYGITTNSWKEFLLVLGEVVKQIAESKDDDFPVAWREAAAFLSASQAPLPAKGEWPTEWPKETKNIEHGGGRKPEAQQFLKELLKLNKELAESGDKELMLEEGIMLRLYTGPLFEKYNVVPRGGSLDGCDNAFMEQLFRDLCCQVAASSGDQKREWMENRYPTSIHVLASGVNKLSALSEAATVYRGLGGNLLPKPFWTPDKFGCKGGVEFGFMSTTRDRSVAAQYAGNGSVRMVLEIETGIVDRGADLRTLSQYPQEAELLFPPLTCLQVLRTKSERGVLVVKTRANVNLKGGTIDEVISKRYQVLKTMAVANTLEADQLLRSSTWPRLLAGWERDGSWVDAQLLNEFRGVLKKRLGGILSAKATAYNEDSTFLTAVRDLVQLQANYKLQSSSLLRDVAKEAKHERLLELAEQREDLEVQKEIVVFAFQTYYPGTGSLWLFDVLGFEKALDGLYYPSRDRTQYRDGVVNEMADVATKGVELPGSDWALLAINGSRDLQSEARKLQSQWKPWTTMEMELELCRPTSRQDFGVALRKAIGQKVEQMTDLFLSNHRCEDLDLNEAGLDDEQGARFAKALCLVGSHLVNLEQLMLTCNSDLGRKTAAGLAEALGAGALSKLRLLRLGEAEGLFAEVSKETMRDFALGLAQCPVLEELGLAVLGLASKNGAAEALAEALPRCTKLQRVWLTGNPQLFEADPAGVAALCAAVSKLGDLEELYLAATGLAASAGACEALAEALPRCTKLRALGLHGNPELFEADATGSAAVCRALGDLQNLEDLSLRDSGLASPEALEALATALLKFSKLRSLMLDGNEQLQEADKNRVRESLEARERDGGIALETFLL